MVKEELFVSGRDRVALHFSIFILFISGTSFVIQTCFEMLFKFGFKSKYMYMFICTLGSVNDEHIKKIHFVRNRKIRITNGKPFERNILSFKLFFWL